MRCKPLKQHLDVYVVTQKQVQMHDVRIYLVELLQQPTG